MTKNLFLYIPLKKVGSMNGYNGNISGSYNSNIWPPYFGGSNKQERINIVKTAGSFIFDDAENKIFDGISSWWSVCHGYNHPHIVSQMKKCLDVMPHIMFAGITHDYAEKLASQLCDFSFGNFQKTFFCDSGSVAIEVALKMALQYWQALSKPQKKYILSFSGCYHGETFMASGVSSDETTHIAQYTNNILNVKLPKNSEELREFEEFVVKNHKHIACSIIEPLVQGASGLKFYSVEIFRKIFEIIKKHEILFIDDECAMGFFRTGRRFAYDHAEIKPDITCVGKALTGGHISLAGVCTSNEIFNTICSDGYFRHGPTFMANPLACSAASASIDIFNEFNYVNHIKKITSVFEQLKASMKNSLNLEARVFGAIFAVEINAQNTLVKSFVKENLGKFKLWVRPIGNTLYLMPPLNSEIEDLEIAVKSFEIIVKNLHNL